MSDLTCTNPDCSFDGDGQCVEGEDPAACPFRSGKPLIDADDLSDDVADDMDDAIPDDRAVALGSGTRLTADACAPILAAHACAVTSLLAPKGAGKTSLIAAVYEHFLEGRSADLSFSESATLLDLERISHLSRAESGRIYSDMERTKRAEGLGYFHLQLKSSDGVRSLLMGDRPGETVLNASNGEHEADKLKEIPSSSSILYLMDGALLSENSTKDVPLSQAIAVLEGIHSVGYLQHKPALAIVLTKSDLLSDDAKRRHIRNCEVLSRRFDHHFSSIQAFETSANPALTETAVERGHGLAELIQFMITAATPTFAMARTPRDATRSYQLLRATP